MSKKTFIYVFLNGNPLKIKELNKKYKFKSTQYFILNDKFRAICKKNMNKPTGKYSIKDLIQNFVHFEKWYKRPWKL